jgi:PAS domain-containing protein
MNPNLTVAPNIADPDAQIERLSEQLAQLEEENALLEEALGRNTRMFEALLSGSNQGIALTGPDRRIVRVIKGLTDLSAASLCGQEIEVLAIPDDRPLIVEAYRELLEGARKKVGIVIRVTRPDGEIVKHAATLTDMLDDPGVLAIVWNYSVAA